MCLYRITESYDPPLPRVFAWKVFSVPGDAEDGLYPEFRGNEPYEVGKWYEAQGGFIYAANGAAPLEKYQAGFHAFLEKGDAERWADSSQEVCRVELNAVHTHGSEQYYEGPPVYVARWMRILPEEEKK